MGKKSSFFVVGRTCFLFLIALCLFGLSRAATAVPQTAIVIEPELKAYAERLPSSLGARPELQVGEALGRALVDASTAVGTEIMVTDKLPGAGTYDKIVRIEVDRRKSGIKFLSRRIEPPPTSDYSDESAARRFVIVLTVEVLDGRSLEVLRKQTIQGRAIFSERRDAYTDPDDYTPTSRSPSFEASKAKSAAELAISQATKRFSQLLRREITG